MDEVGGRELDEMAADEVDTDEVGAGALDAGGDVVVTGELLGTDELAGRLAAPAEQADSARTAAIRTRVRTRSLCAPARQTCCSPAGMSPKSDRTSSIERTRSFTS